MNDDKLDTYKKTKIWLTNHVHRNYFPRNPEFQLLYNLLDRHPSKGEWTYQEPISFKISRMPGNGSIVLYVRFSGLSRYRIVSWVACSKGKLSKHQTADESKLTGAMRNAVRQQINQYKRNHKTRICDLCGSTTRIEVDHHPIHFVDLKTNFIEMKTKKNESPPTDFKWHPKRGSFMFKNGTKENNYYEKRWKQSWQRYHNKNATYRYLCSICNKKCNKKE